MPVMPGKCVKKGRVPGFFEKQNISSVKKMVESTSRPTASGKATMYLPSATWSSFSRDFTIQSHIANDFPAVPIIKPEFTAFFFGFLPKRGTVTESIQNEFTPAKDSMEATI